MDVTMKNSEIDECDESQDLKVIVREVKCKMEEIYNLLERQDANLTDIKGHILEVEGGLMDEDRCSDYGEEKCKWLLNKSGQLLKVKCIKRSEKLPTTSGRTGKSVNKFLTSVSQLLKYVDLPRDDWVEIVSTRLRGQAKTWWRANKKSNMTWNEFAIQLAGWAEKKTQGKRVSDKLNKYEDNRQPQPVCERMAIH